MFENSENISQQSRQRLDKISHHFMSDSPIKTTKRRIPLFLPILIDGVAHKKLILELNEELIRTGLLSCIIDTNDIYTSLTMSGYLSTHECWPDSFDDMHNQKNRMNAYNMVKKQIIDKKMGDIYLLPYTYEQLFVPELFGKAVIIATSNLDEIRTAYADIKILSNHSVNSIGIIMAYSSDIDTATQYFTKLSEGVRKFLGFNIYENGYLLNNRYKNNTNKDLNQASNGIEKIAINLVKNWGLSRT